MKNVASAKKKRIIENYIKAATSVGDLVLIKEELMTTSYGSKTLATVKVIEIREDGKLIVQDHYGSYQRKKIIIKPEFIVERKTFHLGANPFVENNLDIRTVNYTLESIISLFELDEDRGRDYDIDGVKIRELNWNPYIYDASGTKQYYQRGFVWTLKQKQNLIDSIYNGIECGRVLVRKRSWDELKTMKKQGETDLAFNDIVDGKQRMNTIKEFINNEFKDSYGNYFNDLSDRSQWHFVNHQLFGYAEIHENANDADVLQQFLKTNFTGVPQSKEHIEYVKSLYDKTKKES